MMRTQECFAIKPGINGHLDVARKRECCWCDVMHRCPLASRVAHTSGPSVYSQTIEDVYALASTYQDDCT